MGFFPKKNKQLLPEKEAAAVVEAIRYAESITSGEVRVYIESKCKFVNAIDKAWEVFFELKMEATKERNAVLVYLALDDRQIAIVGDEGIHQKVQQENFWKNELAKLKDYCKQDKVTDGLVEVVKDIGKALSTYFPHKIGEDHNEIPDEIVFGK